MKNILVLLVACNLFLPYTCFKHYSTRRVRDSIPAQTIYFYPDELEIVGKLLSGTNVSGEHEYLLRIASALGISEKEVENSLADTAGTEGLIQNIAKKALVSLAETIQSGDTRYLEVVNKIPAVVLSLLGNLHQEKVLSESELQLTQDNLGDILFGVLTSNDTVITRGERMIALKGLEEYGRENYLRSLIDLQDSISKNSMLAGIDLVNLNTTISVLASKFLPGFKSFSELENIVRGSGLQSVALRTKDGHLVEIKDIETHVRFFAIFWWEKDASIKLSNGEVWNVTWDEFLDKVSAPVVWNNFL